MYSVKNTL